MLQCHFDHAGEEALPGLGQRPLLGVPSLFLTPDPIGQDGGMNLYAYVGNDLEANAMARTAADAINQFNGAAFGAGFDLLRKGQDPSPAPRPEFRPRISLDGGRS